ncbi:alpha/beta fold hydrolase [Anaerosporobacter faecicola]|uniref:alpha/beta fold hydrolase n=1 Tax=Anaerosporobacter faecicola TaxID=2718714 RepID=UPI00143C926E|nr:alpha/beta hydrolase [Anaerosporobacter faecicola]
MIDVKGLVLYGANCTVEVWEKLKTHLEGEELTYVAYPHEVTEHANGVEEITKWVFDTYGKQQYDYIIGHSMGGIIGLELLSLYDMECKKVILIESNLRPAELFYRNLLTDTHMEQYGEEVVAMIRGEAPFYSSQLKEALQEEFDYTEHVKKLNVHKKDTRIFGIYGDRGVRKYERRLQDLCLDRETERKITFSFIKDACHMPMLENPVELAMCIREIIYENGRRH